MERTHWLIDKHEVSVVSLVIIAFLNTERRLSRWDYILYVTHSIRG